MTSRVKTPPRNGGDGRSTRWSEHRESRRFELVAAAVAAIDDYGSSASIAEIAASAGVSKPVLYRYFADKDDLYRAVGRWGAEQVMEAVVPTLLADGPMREKVFRACDAYLALLAEHPQVFLLLIEHRSADDPLADGKEQIATSLAKLMGDTLRHLGVDAAAAEPWAHGVVGMGLAVGEWWLRRDIMSRESAADYLAAFLWNAFSGFVADHGVGLDGSGQLRLVEPAPKQRTRRRKDA
jgi:AcrR family transcriptional regulator